MLRTTTIGANRAAQRRLPVRVLTRAQAELEEHIERCRLAGICSVCATPAPSYTLDASGRCDECQP